MTDNDDDGWHRRSIVSWAQTLPPEPPTLDEKWHIRLLAIIEIGRQACDPALPGAKRAVYARQFMEATDPVRRLAELGGTGA